MRRTVSNVGSENTYNDINSEYKVYLIFKEQSANDNDAVIETTSTFVEMTDCSTIEDPMFQIGGTYYDFIQTIPDGTALCPPTGTMNINGISGTSLFV